MRPSPRDSQPAARPAEDIAQEIARLGAMSIGELRLAWQATLGSEPPAAFSKDLLARAISYRFQEQAFGGLAASTARLLRALPRPGAEAPRQVKVGSVVVREHKGVLHEVLVAPGGFCWQGKTYDSLSAIAKRITGVSWNGPRFFGLRSKETGRPTEPRARLSSSQEPAVLGAAETAASIAPRRAGRRSSLRTGSFVASGDRP